MIFNKSYILITFVLLFSNHPIKAQQERIDSLKQVFESEKDIKQRFELAIDLYEDYTYINVDSAYHYAMLSNDLARIRNSQQDLGASFEAIGVTYHVQAKYDQALVWFDSAYQTAIRINHTENQLTAMNNLGMVYNRTGQGSKALELFMTGLELAEQNGFLSIAGSMSGNLGISFLNKASYDSARLFFEKSYDYFKQSGNAENQSMMSNNIGTAYFYQADWPKAYINYKKGLEEATAINYTRSINNANSNIALIFNVLEDHEKSIQYSLPILQEYRRSGLKENEARTALNIAISYDDLGKHEEALKYGKQALEIFENSRSSRLSSAYLNVGRIHYELGEKELAYDYFDKAIALARKGDNIRIIIKTNVFLATDYLENDKLKSCIDLLSENIELLSETSLPEDWLDTYSVLSDAYYKIGDDKKAYDYLKKANIYSDQINEEERTNALARSAIEFETEKREQELIQLKQDAVIADLQVKEQSYFIIVLGIATASVILLALILYLLARQKRRKLLHSNQLMNEKLLRVQLNPHFIFNALNAIQRYIYSADTNSANQFLSKFARLMRQTLENSRTDFIPLSEEIEMLEDYMTLQNLRKSFNYKITYDDDLDPETISLPPMFAQPFVENAIEHGLSGNEEKGEIHIHFSLEEDALKLTIKDNGAGLEATSVAKGKKHKSRATSITEERIRVLAENLKKKIAFEVQGLNKGTKVVFHLPFQQL